LEELPGFETSEPDYGDLVSPDVDLGWTSANADDEGLPGDLADFASLADSSEPEIEEPLPEEVADLPTFDLSDFENLEESPVQAAAEPWSLPEPEATSEPWSPEPESAAEPWSLPEPESAEEETWQADEASEPEEIPELEAVIEFETVAEIEAIIEPDPWSYSAPEEPAAQPDEPKLAAEPEPEPEPEAVEPMPDSPPDELVTETMAELLTEQGLHHQAAEIYRTLIRERPWDPDLKDRLANSEAQASQPFRSAPEPVSEAPPEEAPDAGREEELPSPWTSVPTGSANAPTPYAWAEENGVEATEDGPPISGYFRSLLAWRPGSGAPAGAPAFSPPPAEPEPEPEVSNFEPPPNTGDQPAFLELDTLADEGSSSQGMPWEAPEPTPAPPAPMAAPPAAKSDNPVDAAFDEWFNSADAAETTATPSPESAARPDESAEGEDDDDLEMFRSWLQSLKK
jgi:hypothetical protein